MLLFTFNLLSDDRDEHTEAFVELTPLSIHTAIECL